MVSVDPRTLAEVSGPAPQLAPISRAPMTPGEVRELWAFVHGDIMVGGIRSILRRSLGLCPRHAWGYAAVEIELWEHGAGARGGHQPFDLTILYKDLAAELAEKLTAHHAPWHTDLRDVITPTQGCRICSDLHGTDQAHPPVGYAGMNIPALTDVSNRLQWTAGWIRETEPLWRTQVCPVCAQPRSYHSDEHPLLCRHHMVGAPLHAAQAAQVGRRLAELSEQMSGLVQSMTGDGPHAGPEQNAAWVIALSWFATWETVLDISASPNR